MLKIHKKSLKMNDQKILEPTKTTTLRSTNTSQGAYLHCCHQCHQTIGIWPANHTWIMIESMSQFWRFVKNVVILLDKSISNNLGTGSRWGSCCFQCHLLKENTMKNITTRTYLQRLPSKLKYGRFYAGRQYQN